MQSYNIQLEHGWKWAGVGYLVFFYMFATGLCMAALQFLGKVDVRKAPHVEDKALRKAPTLRSSAADKAIRHSKSSRLAQIESNSGAFVVV